VRQRRSLTHVGGAVESSGRPRVAAVIAEALQVEPARVAEEPQWRGSPPAADDDPERAHIHGFHTYPARMHPTTAARLVRALAPEARATVLDPFCGSGTVVVEAMIAGRRGIGVDLNPLAVRLAGFKIGRRDPAFLESIVKTAAATTAFADDRRVRRAGATHRYAPDDVQSFDPHVLLELDSLRAGLRELSKDERELREALELVLSSILVKVSSRVSDTSTARAPRRIAAGFTAKLFARKANEVARRLSALDALVPADAPAARVALDDATRLRSIPASSVDAIITSPPYASTHDYLAHHALRLRWLDLDARELAAREVGARRRYAHVEPGDARATWTRELCAVLSPMARVCKKGGKVALLLADSAVHGEALRADDIVADAADQVGLVTVARASQRRPHFHEPTAGAFRDSPRAEHVLVLEKP
jgi:DNA modification methylase